MLNNVVFCYSIQSVFDDGFIICLMVFLYFIINKLLCYSMKLKDNEEY